MKRRLLSISLALCMVFSLLPITAFAAEGTYGDTAGHWAEAAIERWSGYGVLQGSDGMFRPDDPITRAELAAVIDRVMKYQEKSDVSDFSDVDANAWYASSVLKLNAAGVMLGSGGKLRPNDNITREEAAVMIGRAFAVPENSGNENPFPDAGDISGWASFLVDGMKATGYIGGYPDGSFGPKNTITRAEVVTILDNMVDSFYHEAGEVDNAGISFSPKNVVINADGVTLKNTAITGDLYITQGVSSGTVTLENVTVAGTTYVWGGGPDSVIATDCDFNVIHLNANTNPAFKLSAGTKAVRIYLDDTATVTHGGVTVTYNAATDTVTFGGTIDKVTLNADGTATLSIGGIVYDVIPPEGTVSKFELAKDAVVKDMVVNAPVDVTGTGKIEKMEVHSDGVVIDKAVDVKPENITVDKDVKVDVGDKEYTGDGKALPPNTSSSSGGGGGGSGTTYYTITMQNDGNGTAVASSTSAAKGITITLTATPNSGFVFKQWVVVSGGATLSSTTTNPATFTMPAENVSVKAEFDYTADGAARATTIAHNAASSGGGNQVYSFTPPAGATIATANVTYGAGTSVASSLSGTGNMTLTIADTVLAGLPYDLDLTATYTVTYNGNTSTAVTTHTITAASVTAFSDIAAIRLAAANAEVVKITGFTATTNTTSALIFNPDLSMALDPGTVINFVSFKTGADSASASEIAAGAVNFTDNKLQVSTQNIVDAADVTYVSVTFTVTLNGTVSAQTGLAISSLFSPTTTAGLLRTDKAVYLAFPDQVLPWGANTWALTLSNGVTVPGVSASTYTIGNQPGEMILTSKVPFWADVTYVLDGVTLQCDGTAYALSGRSLDVTVDPLSVPQINFIAPAPITENDVIATVTFSPSSPQQGGTSVTAIVTLSGTALEAGTFTIDLTSEIVGLASNPRNKPVTESAVLTDTFEFSFDLLIARGEGGTYPDLDDLELTFSFVSRKIELINAAASSGDWTGIDADAFSGAGITYVTAGNLADVQTALQIAYNAYGRNLTTVEIQTVVDSVVRAWNALAAINAAASSANWTGVTTSTFKTAGIIGVTEANLADVQAALVDAYTANGSSDLTTVEIQDVVAEWNLAVINAAASSEDWAGIDESTFIAAGITGVIPANFERVKSAVQAAYTLNGRDLTKAEIQAVVNTVL